MANLYGISWCCDEGFDGFEFLFRADSELQVATKMISMAREEKGKMYHILHRMSYRKEFDSEHVIYFGDDDVKFAAFLKELEPVALLNYIEQTRVDGDSEFALAIHLIDPKTAIGC